MWLKSRSSMRLVTSSKRTKGFAQASLSATRSNCVETETVDRVVINAMIIFGTNCISGQGGCNAFFREGSVIVPAAEFTLPRSRSGGLLRRSPDIYAGRELHSCRSVHRVSNVIIGGLSNRQCYGGDGALVAYPRAKLLVFALGTTIGTAATKAPPTSARRGGNTRGAPRSRRVQTARLGAAVPRSRC